MKGCHENRPEVSVVIPVYNAEKYLRQTMNYLLYQTLEEIEFIFVDDGSSDRSVMIIQEYMERYKDKIYLYHTDHTGPGGARNKGIEHARADYIGFADADDYFIKNYKEFEIRIPDGTGNSGTSYDGVELVQATDNPISYYNATDPTVDNLIIYIERVCYYRLMEERT